MRTKQLGTALLALTIVGGLGACSDDEGSVDAGGDGTTTTAGAAGDGNGGGAELVAACEAYAALPDAMGQEGPPEDPDLVESLVSDLEAGAPDAVADDVAVVAEAVRAALGGDPEAFGDEEFGVFAGIGGTLVDECPADEVLEVGLFDFGFDGLPETVPAGRVNVRLTNESESEFHEMALLRRNDGESRSFEELLELPEEEAGEAVEFVGIGFAAPGETGAAFLELEAGDYLAVCFIPVGGGETGPPHFTQGMQQEFTVE